MRGRAAEAERFLVDLSDVGGTGRSATGEVFFAEGEVGSGAATGGDGDGELGDVPVIIVGTGIGPLALLALFVFAPAAGDDFGFPEVDRGFAEGDRGLFPLDQTTVALHEPVPGGEAEGMLVDEFLGGVAVVPGGGVGSWCACALIPRCCRRAAGAGDRLHAHSLAEAGSLPAAWRNGSGHQPDRERHQSHHGEQKNWMCVGGEDTGERSAIIYTLIESARRCGHELYAYLGDLLERLPGMRVGEINALLPSNWQPAGREAASLEIAG